MGKYNMDDYTKNIKKVRRKMIVTQEEFVKKVDAPFEIFNRWKNGKHEPTIKTKRKILQLINLVF